MKEFLSLDIVRFSAILLSTFAFIVVSFISLSIASADSVTWVSSSNPTIEWDDVPNTSWEILDGCHEQIDIPVEGRATSFPNACVYNGKFVKLAFSGSNYNFVSFNSDTNFYSSNNTGASGRGSVLIPGTDRLIRRGYLDWRSSSLALYDDFAARLTKPPLSQEYYWNSDNPNYELRDENGDYIKIKAVGYSENGKYIVAEAPYGGIIFVNAETHEPRLISKYKGQYGVGIDPGMELRVSNDGGHVAIAGINTQFRVIDIDSNCGDTPTTTILNAQDMPNPCPERELYSLIYGNVPNARMPITYPRFNYDSGKLSVHVGADPYDETKTRVVTLTAPGYTAPRLDYLALGDSISSGEGDTVINPETHNKYYRSFTDNEEYVDLAQPREKCHLSTRSYPYLLASWMNLTLADNSQSIGDSSWQSVACSGAAASDVFASNDNYLGQAKGGGSSLPRLTGYSNVSILKNSALEEFIPGRNAQLEFVKKYQPKVVTITLGANNIDFANKLESCVFPTRLGIPFTCDWATTDKQKLGRLIQNQYDNLKILFQKLAESDTQVYAIGYPHLISNTEPANCDWNTGTLDLTERRMIYNATSYFNLVIQHAANISGVQYIDISHALDGGRLCDEGQEYMTGASFLGSSEIQESFHPNDYGHIKIAQVIEQAVGDQNLLDYSIQPGTETDKPPIPPELGGPTDLNVHSTHAVAGNITKGTDEEIVVDKYTLQPGSQLDVTLHSDPISLGQLTVATDGSIDTTIAIPTSVPAGYHTLIITGQTYSGEPIELLQTVLVKGSNPDDIDENGTPDDQQLCGPFMIASGIDEDRDNIDDACDMTISSDITPPTLGIPSWSTSPIIHGDTTTLTIPVTDDISGVAKSEYYIGSTDPGQGNGIAFDLTDGSLIATLTNLQPGKNTIHYRAVDKSENWTDTKQTAITVHPQTPSVSTNSSFTNTAPFISWQTIVGTHEYSVFRDGVQIDTTQTNEFTDTTATEQRKYTYTILATTADGISSDISPPLTITIDTTPPQVFQPTISGTGTLPFFSMYLLFGLNNLTISANASDAISEISHGEFYIDTNQTNITPMQYTNNMLTTTTNLSAQPFSWHILYVRAQDRAGNWSKPTGVWVWYL